VTPPREPTAKTSEAETPTRGNPETRQQILKAALRALEQKNVAEVRVDDIVQEAGVARGTFYIYFRDKLDVLKALSWELHEELFNESHVALDRRSNAYDRLRQSLRRVIDNWLEHGNVFTSITQLAMTHEDFLAISQEQRYPFIRQIKRDIEASIERGRARPIDAAVAAKALAAMMDWFCLLWFGLDEPPYEDAHEHIDDVVDNLATLWYRAVYAADPPGTPAP
jgi:AcrR family transcriptional regulator